LLFITKQSVAMDKNVCENLEYTIKNCSAYFTDASFKKLTKKKIYRIIKLYQRAILATKSNIYFKNSTTYEAQGIPYARQFLYVINENKIELREKLIIEYKKNLYHLDTIMKGENKGKVAYPGYSIVKEFEILGVLIHNLHSLKLVLQKKKIDINLDEINADLKEIQNLQYIFKLGVDSSKCVH